MRVPPPIASFPRFPVVAGTALLAIAVTIAKEYKVPGVWALACDPHVAFGEPWRLITSTLIHGDFLHLLFNVYWLWVLGSFVEETFGHLFTVGLILLLAAGSSAAEYAFLEGGVGLSGVGYGLFGMLWMLSRFDPRYRDVVDKNTITLFVAWFFICIVATYANILRIANIAHGVGAVLGVLVGCAVARRKWRVPAGGGAVALTALFCVLAILLRPSVNLHRERGVDEYNLGTSAIEEADYPQAEKWLRQAVRLNPKMADAWQNLGVALHHQGKSEASNEALVRATALRQ